MGGSFGLSFAQLLCGLIQLKLLHMQDSHCDAVGPRELKDPSHVLSILLDEKTRLQPEMMDQYLNISSRRGPHDLTLQIRILLPRVITHHRALSSLTAVPCELERRDHNGHFADLTCSRNRTRNTGKHAHSMYLCLNAGCFSTDFSTDFNPACTFPQL